MKIGIISINLYTKWLNPACPLHSYAMQQFLLKNGYENQVVDYKASYYDNFNMSYPSDYYEELYLRKLNNFPAKEQKRDDWFKSIIETKSNGKNYGALREERASRYAKFKNFIDTHLTVTEKCYTSASLEFEDPGLDCYMCVTDVIWKAEPSLERAFFLANRCMDNKIKIAYSASRGSSHTKTPKQKKQFFKYLKDFDAISVREPSLKEHIDENSDIESTVVVDPVMLHDAEFYGKLAKKPEEEGYLLLYHVVQVGDDTIEQAVKYAKAHDLTIIELSDRPYPEGKLTKYEGFRSNWVYDFSIEEWLGYIQNAKCVFTNSFHCCCLSIIFGKSFFAGSRNGDKVDVVLGTYGLQNRRFDIDTDIIGNDPGEIDYERVHAKLKEKREESGNWLLEALRKAEAKPAKHKDYDAARKKSSYSVTCNLNIPDDSNTRKKRALKSPNIKTEIKGKNDGETVFEFYTPSLHSYRFLGWSFRCKIDKEFYRFTKDGKFAPWEEVSEEDYRIFASGEKIPHIPANGVTNVTADAIWEKLVPTFSVMLNSGLKADSITEACDKNKGELYETKNGIAEYKLNTYYKNDGSFVIPECPFSHKEGQKQFTGWKIRFRLDGKWYQYINDSTSLLFSEAAEIRGEIFQPGEKAPILPEGIISDIILKAAWIYPSCSLAYHSGTLKVQSSKCTYDELLGIIKATDKGAFEYLLNEKIATEGKFTLLENGFIPKDSRIKFKGWYLRVKIGSLWYWYLADGTVVDMNEYSASKHGQRKVFIPGEEFENPRIPAATDLVAVATWKLPQPLIKRIKKAAKKILLG